MAQEQVQLSELTLEERMARDAAEVDVDHVYNATFPQDWREKLLRRSKQLRSIPVQFHGLRRAAKGE